MKKTGKKNRKKRILIAAGITLAVLLIAYFVLVWFLVSAALVPSFMEKLDKFEELTEKSYSEMIYTDDIVTNELETEEEVTEWVKTVDAEQLYMTSDDGYKLDAVEFYPESDTTEESIADSHRWVLLLHGYTGWKEEMYPLAYWYVQRGYHALVPDLRCQGDSEGDFIGMGWTDHTDCMGWLDIILEQDPDAEILLHGQSMGAATALIMSGDQELTDHVKAVVADCSFTDAYTMFGDKAGDWFGLPAFPLVDSCRLMLLLRGGYDLNDASPVKAVAKSTVPTLFIHGDKDEMIDVSQAYELYDAASCEKQLLIIEGAGHCQAQYKDPDAYYGAIESFAEPKL